MAKLSDKQWDKEWAKLVEDIQTNVPAFTSDTTERQIARKKRALVDRFFFAAVYFPHYISLPERHKHIWKFPDARIDWTDAGFADVHPEFWSLGDLDNTFKILASFRESAKDTLLGKIDPLHKAVFQLNWFTAILALTAEHAVTKVMPLKLELENNKRLRHDFGDLVGRVKWEQDEFILSNGRKFKSYGIDQSLRGQENFSHRVDYFQLNDIEDPTQSFNYALCMQTVQSIRQDKIMSVDSQKWGGLYLCNYVSTESITHELLKGRNTGHFVKKIFSVLVPNERKTKAEKEIAAECKKAGLSEAWKSVWESRHPTVKLLRDWKNDPDTFEPEMMMWPKAKKTAKFRDADFKFYSPAAVKNRSLRAVTFIDPSAKEAGDYKAVITLALSADVDDIARIVGGESADPDSFFQGFCLCASIRQESIDWLLKTTYEHFNAFRSVVVGVEMISGFALLEREYLREMAKRKQVLPFHKVDRVENKSLKIERLVPVIRSGLFRFNPDPTVTSNGVTLINDTELLIQQFKAFGTSTAQVSHGGIGDDGPDAFAEAVKLIDAFGTFSGDSGVETISVHMAEFGEGAY